MMRAKEVMELYRSSIQVGFLVTDHFYCFCRPGTAVPAGSSLGTQYILLCGEAEYVARSTMTLDNITATISLNI